MRADLVRPGLVQPELFAANAHANAGVAKDHPPVIQPPLGVASKRLPSLSTTEIWVVSFDMPAESRPSEANWSSRENNARGEFQNVAFQ